MAWGGRELTKEEALKTLGLSEQQLNDLIASQQKVTELETTNATLKTDLEGIKGSLAALEGRVRPTQDVTPPTGGNNGADNQLPDWDNPDAAFNSRVAPVAMLALESKAELVFSRVYRRLAAEDSRYAKLEAEAAEILKGEHPQVRANEKVVEHAFKIALANALPVIEKEKAVKGSKWFIETGSNQTVTVTDPNNGLPQLTEAQKQAAAKFGLSEEAYQKSLATMTVVR